MRARALVLVVLLGFALSGATYPWTSASTFSAEVVAPETTYGRAHAGASVGVNATNATVTLTRTTSTTTTDVLWLNNTNASGSAWARIHAYTLTGAVGRIVTLDVSLDVDGVRTSQVLVAGGTLTQSTGAYVLLPPGSANKLAITQRFTNHGGTDPSVFMDVYVADDAEGASYGAMKLRVNLV